MCELFAMSSRQPATVAFSLEKFAQHGGQSGPHKDGWGIAYHQERDAWVIKETVPASSSDLVRFIECHHLRSTLVISHIRKATRGGISFENTQPYCRELGGRAHVLAHNGDLVDVRSCPELRTGRIRPMGTTGLYTLCRTCTFEPSDPRTKGVSVVPGPGEQRVFLVASVPLTDEDWQPLGEGELVVVSNGASVTRVTT